MKMITYVKAIRRLPRLHACSLLDGFGVLAGVGEVQILVLLLDIDEVLVIVNIVGIEIRLSRFLLIALGLHLRPGSLSGECGVSA